MSTALGGFGDFLNHFLVGDDTSDSDGYHPPNIHHKRKARTELLQPSPSHRSTRALGPSPTHTDYESADSFTEAAERRTSKAGYLVLESSAGSDFSGESSRRFSVYNGRRPTRNESVGKPPSPEGARAGRLKKFMNNVTNKLENIVDGLHEAIHGADEAHMGQRGPNEKPSHDRADVGHANKSAGEAQAWARSPGAQAEPIREHRPSSGQGGEEQAQIESSATIAHRSATETQWIERPNFRARHIIHRTSDLSKASVRIKAELGEPEYAYRDIEIRDAMWQIMDKMERLARQHFSYDMPRNKKQLERDVLSNLDSETAHIIGCVASGGPNGEDGWRELFWDDQKRRALVCAVVGNVLVEQVFQHACFGADAKLLQELAKIQEDMQNKDGFARNTAYATHLRNHLLSPITTTTTSSLCLPPSFLLHVSTIVHTLLTHLAPLLPASTSASALTQPLTSLATAAGLLALHMRLDPHTVYHHVPVLKDAVFKPPFMEAFNKAAMTASHPRDPATVFPPGTSDAEKRRVRGDEPRVQIVLMDGLTAYRKGGWEARESRVWKPVFAEKEGAEMGIRARVLVHGWVFCRWGRARGEGGQRVHGEGWREPGFVEFRKLRWTGV